MGDCGPSNASIRPIRGEPSSPACFAFRRTQGVAQAPFRLSYPLKAFDSVRVPVRLRRLSGIGFAITNPSTDEDSLTEAPAPSLLHIEVKMALVGFIGPRSQHGAEDAASVIVD